MKAFIRTFIIGGLATLAGLFFYWGTENSAIGFGVYTGLLCIWQIVDKE